MTQAVYRFEDLFKKLTGHLDWMWWPMIGGLIIGLGGLIDSRALGVGYDTIHAELLGELGVSALALSCSWSNSSSGQVHSAAGPAAASWPRS